MVPNGFQIDSGFPGEPTKCKRLRLHDDFESKPRTMVRGQELFFRGRCHKGGRRPSEMTPEGAFLLSGENALDSGLYSRV